MTLNDIYPFSERVPFAYADMSSGVGAALMFDGEVG